MTPLQLKQFCAAVGIALIALVFVGVVLLAVFGVSKL